MSAIQIEDSFPVLSVNTGRVTEQDYKGKLARSGIGKHQLLHEAALGAEGLENDEQADQVNHGGPDKAICVYAYRHYARWEAEFGQSLAFGAFGENFTVDELLESDVSIGDIFSIGTALVQISQPRIPCWKLAMKWGRDDLPARVLETGATGFYLRVLSTGIVKPGPMLRTQRHPDGLTVTEANRIMHQDKQDAAGIRRLLSLAPLADSWRTTLQTRLEKLMEAGEIF